MSGYNKGKPEWYVFYENINYRRIEKYNVFDHAGFMKDCNNALVKYKNDFPKFEDSVRHSLMYHFWSKCEWEIILSAFPPSEKVREKKIDVYEQVMLNWDKFIGYLWEMREKYDCV